VGVPFKQDGLRDGEHLRSWMTERFSQMLSTYARRVPWFEVIGTPDDRVAAVLAHIDSLPPLLHQPGTSH
jgi:HTH-type transcriptional regulator, transcriptional repressor of NAD biosynthesis genes